MRHATILVLAIVCFLILTVRSNQVKDIPNESGADHDSVERTTLPYSEDNKEISSISESDSSDSSKSGNDESSPTDNLSLYQETTETESTQEDDSKTEEVDVDVSDWMDK